VVVCKYRPHSYKSYATAKKKKKIIKNIHQSLYYLEQGQNNEFIEHKANGIESSYEPL
jgi:hypothetical protein